ARHELARHRAADDLALELEAAAARRRLEANLDAGELAGAASLLLVGVVVFDRPRYGLAERDQERTESHADAEFPEQAVDRAFEVGFAGAFQVETIEGAVGAVGERRVFRDEARQR